MLGIIGRIAKRLGGRMLLVALVCFLAVAGLALWLHLNKAWQLQTARDTERNELVIQREAVLSRLARLEGEVKQLSEAAQEQRQRLALAKRLAESTNELLSWWDRLFMDADEMRRLERRKELAETAEAEASAAVERLQALLRSAGSERDLLSADASGIAVRLGELDAAEDPYVLVLRESWQRLKAILITTALLILFGPIVWRLFCYFGWAAWVQRGRPDPVGEAGGFPHFGRCTPALNVSLQADEELLVRPAAAQSSDESLLRRHRWIADPRRPFTCFAAGLYGLYGYRPAGSGAEGAAVTVAPPDFGEATDCLEIELKAGDRVIVRPADVVGLVIAKGATPRVHARWQLRRRAAWLALRLRLLEYEGPCRILLRVGRGVRAEASDGFGRRARPGAVVAFTPGLAWGCVRAETFWGYAFAKEPLFDEVYRGRGWIVLQEGGGPGAAQVGRWWQGLADGLLRIFGI